MKRITKIGGFLLILFQNFQSFSQEDFIYENQVWVGYITSARISDRISI